MPSITKEMIDFVINWAKVSTHYTIVRIEHDGKSRNIWVDVGDIDGKSREEVKDILQSKANKAFEAK